MVRDGLIAAVGDKSKIEMPAGARGVDARGLRVIPGLVDLHVHGIDGEDVASGDISTISEALARHGVTAFVAVLAAAPQRELIGSIERLAANVDAGASGGRAHIWTPARSRQDLSDRRAEGKKVSGAKVVGIYLEGPYISPRQAGALDSRFFRPPDRGEAMELLRAGRGAVRIWTVAPELGGSKEIIAWLSSEGVVPSVGHSDASFEQVAEAVRYGLSHATHTFNAMRQFHHRGPGAVGAVLGSDEIVAEVIADGHHVHPAAVSLLIRLKGVERTCLVSDSMPLAGLPLGVYSWLGRKVMIDGRTARLENGTLAGSVMPLNIALRNLVETMQIPFETALKTASSTPARVLSLNSGAIEVGRDADISVVDDAFECHLTIVQGRIAFEKVR